MPGASVSPQVSVSNEGLFGVDLGGGTVAQAQRYAVARREQVVLGRSDALTVGPGKAALATSRLDVDTPSFPADGATEIALTLVAKDAFGNAVADGTVVRWETNGEGELFDV